MAAKKTGSRTTHRSSTGKKDIQTYKRAQGADIKRKSKAETKSKKKK